MWQVKRRSLIATKLERALKPVQKPHVSSREHPWIRASIREPESTLNPTLEGFGIHPIFQNPTAPRSKGINLDKLRELNMGHLNIQLHPESQVSSVCASARSEYQRESEFNDANAEETPVSKTPHAFVVPEGWRTLTLTPSKPRNVDEQGNKRQLLALTDRAAASPFSSSSAKDVADSDVAAAEMKKSRLNLRKGFFTEDQGIGTARGASPYHKAEVVGRSRRWGGEDWSAFSQRTSPIHALEDYRITPRKCNWCLADASTHGGLSPTGLRLQHRARKLKLWHERLNPPYGKPGKPVVLQGVVESMKAANTIILANPAGIFKFTKFSFVYVTKLWNLVHE
jgi:hypothetical protein